MLAQLKARLRNIGIMKRLYSRFRRIVAVPAESWDNIRQLILKLWLMLIYYALLTPAGLARRMLGRGFPPPEARRGWQKINQRSSEVAMFTKKF